MRIAFDDLEMQKGQISDRITLPARRRAGRMNMINPVHQMHSSKPD
jgi:hypothetical protein